MPESLALVYVIDVSSALFREKELLRALAAQERQATRLRQRDVNTGPKDDLDIEWEQLMEAHHHAGYANIAACLPSSRVFLHLHTIPYSRSVCCICGWHQPARQTHSS